jgi:hypothetical protein
MLVTDLRPAPQHAAKSKVRQFDLKCHYHGERQISILPTSLHGAYMHGLGCILRRPLA